MAGDLRNAAHPRREEGGVLDGTDGRGKSRSADGLIQDAQFGRLGNLEGDIVISSKTLSPRPGVPSVPDRCGRIKTVKGLHFVSQELRGMPFPSPGKFMPGIV